MTRTCWLTLAYLTLMMALWGSSYVVLRVALHELSSLWVIFDRMALDSLVFFITWRWRGHIDYRSGDWKYLLGLTVYGLCLYFLYESFALQYTSVAQARMIIVLLLLLVAVGAWLLLHEQIGRMAWTGFGLAVLGSIQLNSAGEPDLHVPQPLLDNFFEFLAMLCVTGYILLLKHPSARYLTPALTTMQALVGTLFFLPLALISADLPSQPSAPGIQAVVYLDAVATVGAYGLYNFGVGRLPTSQASGFISLILVFILISAALFLDETLSGPQMLTADPVFIGVAINQWRGTPPLPPAGALN